ncbi:MAG: OmpA family protein [Proteobacteria bacterium]|nr:OmpA family protein [Pseudomonadota bacterium]
MRRLTAPFLFALALLLGGLVYRVPAIAADAPAQRFVVYFQEWSAAMDDSALGAIGKAAEFAKAHPAGKVTVTGFADPTGSRKANVLMSQLRAQVVADQLAQDGVPAQHISQGARGSVQFALSSQESRRVEIAVEAR